MQRSVAAATRVHSWSDGDYEYTETEHFLVSRGGDLGFDKVPVDGSEKMANDLMESDRAVPVWGGSAVPEGIYGRLSGRPL